MQPARRPLRGLAGAAALAQPQHHYGFPFNSFLSISLPCFILISHINDVVAIGIETRHSEVFKEDDNDYGPETGLAETLSWRRAPISDVDDRKPVVMRWEARDESSSYAQQGQQGAEHTGSSWNQQGIEDQAGEPNASALDPLQKLNVSDLIFNAPLANKLPSYHEPPPRIIYLNATAHSGIAPKALYLIIAFVTILFYFVHSKMEVLRKTTWEGLTQGLSIFLALTVFDMSKELTDLLVVEEEVGMAFARMTSMMIFLEVALYVTRKDNAPTMLLMLIGARNVGYLSADAFGSMQETPPWNASAGASGAIAGLSLVFWWVIIRLVGWIRYKATHVKAQEGDRDSELAFAVYKAWEARVEAAENEAAAFSIGLVLTQTVRFGICGKPQHIHGVQKNPHSSQINQLLFFGLACGLFIWFFKFLSRKFGHYADKIRRGLDLACAMSAFTMAWSLHYWGRWRFWYATMNKGLIGGGDVMTGQIVMAMFFSTVLSMVILALFRLRSSMATPDNVELVTILITAFNILIGLAWQTCFQTANEQVVGHLLEESSHKAYGRSAIGAVLCIIVAPAWFIYILPNSYFYEKELALFEEIKNKFMEEAKAGEEGQAAEEPASAAPASS
mmetsp:Transcript_5274/g.12622  ORF Transcript_5274/g.12622 Transcript_5274/m.12622 type:complete len:618 (-) Transcript_5274:57-1910(-)